MQILTILLRLLEPEAAAHANLFTQLSRQFKFDPLLVVAVAWRESRLRNGRCYQGSHGLMQIQLKGRSCKKTLAEAKRKFLYSPRANLTRGLELMSYWRRWGKGKPYHWLLHYNQGFGICSGGGRKCSYRKRIPIRTGRIGKYPDRVLKFYQRLKGAEACLKTGKSPLTCRRVIQRQRKRSIHFAPLIM